MEPFSFQVYLHCIFCSNVVGYVRMKKTHQRVLFPLFRLSRTSVVVTASRSLKTAMFREINSDVLRYMMLGTGVAHALAVNWACSNTPYEKDGRTYSCHPPWTVSISSFTSELQCLLPRTALDTWQLNNRQVTSS